MTDPVAIVGVGAVFPAAGDAGVFWDNIRTGVDATSLVPPDRWDQDVYYAPGATGADRFYCRRGGFVDDLATFDPTRFGIMPAAVDATEPDQLLVLRAAAEAVADGGGDAGLPDRSRVGVVIGRGGYLTPGVARLDQRVHTAHQVGAVLRDVVPWLGEDRIAAVREAFQRTLGPEESIGLVPNFAASRVANRFDFRGPAYTVDAACASSLLAVDHAVRELASGRCDAVLAGGVHTCHHPTLWSVFTQLRALSPTERIRPFDRHADGTLLSEGTGVLLLKRLADARAADDRVYAVIRGVGVSGDGQATSMMNPLAEGQVPALEQAWRAAGADPSADDAVGLIEAHGTATPAGDAVELDTLRRVFGTGGSPIALGTVKSMIGHAMPAAGAAGLIKAALALHHATLPPTLHVDDPHPDLAGTRFTPLPKAHPWDRPHGVPRRAAVNAFGFGGINAHVVLEEAPGPGRTGAATPRPPTTEPARRPPEAAPDPNAQVAPKETPGPDRTGVTEPVPQPCGADPDGAHAAPESAPSPARTMNAPSVRPVSDADLTLRPSGSGPEGDAHAVPEEAQRPARTAGASSVRPVAAAEPVLRLAGTGPEDIARALDADDADLLDRAGRDPGDGSARLAIVAPDARKLGLARRIVARGSAWRGRNDVWFTASPLLDGSERVAFLFPGFEPEFAPRIAGVAEHFGLPAPGLTGGDDVFEHASDILAVGRLLAAAMHEIGVAPGVLAGHSLGEWTAMVVAGVYPAFDDFMASMRPGMVEVPDVVYATLGAAADRVAAELDGAGDVVVTHDNCPHQSVICGPQDRIGDVVDGFRSRGVLAQTLPFRTGFHSPMYAPYLDAARATLRRLDVRPPRVPIWSATSLAPFPAAADDVRDLVLRHLVEPVRFRRLTELLHDSGVRAFVQIGPGSLTGFVDDTLRDREHLTVATSVPRHDGLAQLSRVAAALWAEGLSPDFARLADPRAGGEDREPAGHALTLAGGDETNAGHGHTPAGHYGALADHGGASAGHAGASDGHGHTPAGHHGAPVDHGGASASHAGASEGHGGASNGRRASRQPGTGGHEIWLRLGDPFVRLDGVDGLAVPPPAATYGEHAAHRTPADAGPVAAALDAVLADATEAARTITAAEASRTAGAAERANTAGGAGRTGTPGHAATGAERAGTTGGAAHTVTAGAAARIGTANGAGHADIAARTERAGTTSAAPHASTAGSAGRIGTANGAGHAGTAGVAGRIGAVGGAGCADPSGVPASRPRRVASSPSGEDSPGLASTAPASTAPDSTAPDAPQRVGRSRVFSLATMPDIADHCVFPQADGWPDVSDRFPVVPLTTMLDVLGDAARELRPGAVVTALSQVRAARWLTVAPETTTRVDAVHAGTGPGGETLVRVRIDGYADGIVHLSDDGYPDPPEPSADRLRNPRPAPVGPRELYGDRWMFHGPRFAGVSGIGEVGDDGITGVVTNLPAAGALLDSAGQLIGHWMQVSRTVDQTVLPIGIREVRFHGPPPATGARLACTAWIRELTGTEMRADAELRDDDGRVRCRIDGWTTRRFATDERIWRVKFHPERETLSEPVPAGWSLLRERWPDTGSRELMMRSYLGAAERARYEELPPRARRPWLLGRIAVKDAVRRRLWDLGAGPIYPAEITVGNDARGRPYVSGPFRAPDVSLAHCAGAGRRPGLAVALAGPGPVGIDAEPVRELDASAERVAFTETERSWLDGLPGEDRAAWSARLWTAKEAVAKALGTGLSGRPHDFEVSADDPDADPVLVVTDPEGARHRVATAMISHDATEYAVAWTYGGTTG